jgi:hypothetical protein
MAAPTNYNINKYLQGVNGFGALQSNLKYSTTFGGGAAITLTVPSSSAPGTINATKTPRFLAIFTYHSGRNVWVSINGTAVVPAGATLAAVSSELNPPARVVKGGDVISMICATATTDVGVVFYAIQEG